MSNGSYYSGRPMNSMPPEPIQAAPATVQEPPVNGGEQNLASTQLAPETNGYLVDRLIEQNQPAPPAPATRTIEQPQLTGGEQHPVSKADSYYVGRPANYTPPEPQVNGGEQNPVSAQAPETKGYLDVRPMEQNQSAPSTIQGPKLTGGEQHPESEPAPQKYYVGRPIHMKPPSPLPAKNNTTPLPSSPMPAKNNATPPPTSSPPAKVKRSSFLARCFYRCSCLSGGGSSVEQEYHEL